MAREIKFRAKTGIGFSDRNKWVFGDYFSQFKDGVTTYYIVEHPHGRDAGRAVMWPVDPKTVGQFTGLKDKNGKEIYEGDIVHYNTGETWFVEWDISQAGFIYMNRKVLDKLGRKKPSGIGYGQLPGSHEVEIIGNIYENPELLK